MLKRFFREEEGATMVEYGLMIALIAVVLILTVSLLGTSLKESFARARSGLSRRKHSPGGWTMSPLNRPI